MSAWDKGLRPQRPERGTATDAGLYARFFNPKVKFNHWTTDSSHERKIMVQKSSIIASILLVIFLAKITVEKVSRNTTPRRNLSTLITK